MSHTNAPRHAAAMRTVRDSMIFAAALFVIIGASARR
jgi:hypothetical protein